MPALPPILHGYFSVYLLNLGKKKPHCQWDCFLISGIPTICGKYALWDWRDRTWDKVCVLHVADPGSSCSSIWYCQSGLGNNAWHWSDQEATYPWGLLNTAWEAPNQQQKQPPQKKKSVLRHKAYYFFLNALLPINILIIPWEIN